MKIFIGILALCAIFFFAPYLIVSIFYVGVLLLKPLGVLLISYGCYKAISKWFGQKLLGVVVALCLILLPICWVSYANYQYVTACEGVFRVQVFKKQPMPESLLFDDAELQSFRKGINARDMVDKAILKFREGLDSNTFGQSQFVFKATIKNVGVLSAPLYLVTHEIKNIKTGERLARAEDIVFGGGILGPYMALLGGDQDAESLVSDKF